MTEHPAAAVRSPDRLAALHRTALLDTPAEEAFDRLTRLVVKILNAPVSLVTLVDADRQFFKSCVGLPEPWASRRETPLAYSFCRHALIPHEPLVIEDAREHPLVCDSPAIDALGVVAYAGIPLISSDAHVLGTFCVIDHRPRAWTADEIEVLKDLASSVVTEIELRTLAREAELERREKAALLDSAAEGIFGLDRAGRCIFLNRAAIGLFGYRPEEALGRTMHELVHHSRQDGSPYPLEECPVYQAFRRGEATRSDQEVLWRRDGTCFPAEYSSQPLLDGGQVLGAVVTFRDISERQALERMQRELLAIASHDLRTPLTTMKAAVANLLDGSTPADPAQRRELLQALDAETDRLTRLVSRLLQLAGLEGGATRPLRDWYDVEEILIDVIRREDPRAERIRLVVPDGLPPAYVDYTLLEQILTNLVENALKYSPPAAPIEATVGAGDGQLTVEVADRGPGVPPDERERIFEKFYRGPRRAGGQPGTGLGLAIARGFAQALGGQLQYLPRPGGGSVFRLLLPLEPGPPAAP